MTFLEFNLSQNVLKGLISPTWNEPTKVQQETIPAILTGRDVVVCSPTGTGKTASFILPILHYVDQHPSCTAPSVLIIAPTRELAAQIMNLALELGVAIKLRAVNLSGGVAYIPQTRRLRSGVHLIIATPGRLIDYLDRNRVSLSNIKIFVLDEADRMLNRDFIHTIEYINSYLPINKQMILISASLSLNIHHAIQKWLKQPLIINLTGKQVIPDKIKQIFYRVIHGHEKIDLLFYVLKKENIKRAIIFISTQINTEQLSKQLNVRGYKTLPLHGGLKQIRRSFVIKAFQNNKINFIVATDLAARGLDMNSVNYTINYDLPKNCEQYVHRVGRIGRNNRAGIAITFTLPRDQLFLRKLSQFLDTSIEPIQVFKKHNPIKISETLSEKDKKQFLKK